MGAIITVIRGPKNVEEVRSEVRESFSARNADGTQLDVFSVVSAKKAARILGVDVDTVLHEREEMVRGQAEMSRFLVIVRHCGFVVG